VIAAGCAALLAVGMNWGLRHLAAGRVVYATGSSPDAARLAGINPRLVVFAVFVVTGALTGFAAVFNAVRFLQIPSNAGIGLELKVIAAAVVGGVAIAGGRGTIGGTLLGVLLLGLIGPALTFLGFSAYWERAIEGGIILAAVSLDAVRVHSGKAAARGGAGKAAIRGASSKDAPRGDSSKDAIRGNAENHAEPA
jgi:rhamnose transport system permease protein